MFNSKWFKKAVAVVSVMAMGLSLIPVSNASAAKSSGMSAELNNTRLVMYPNAKYTLKVSGKSIKKVLWESKSPKVATVTVKKKNTRKAVVKTKAVKKQSTANIVAKVVFKNRKSRTLQCKVVVKMKKNNNNNNSNVNNNNGDVTQQPAPPQVTSGQQPGGTATAVPNVTQPADPTQDPGAETPVPELDMNNLTVAEYPTIFSDVPDCDFIRVDGAYYMVSTTMNLSPGAPIMKSTDLVHWQIVNYVYDTLFDDDANNLENGKQVYTNGSWAAAIRYNEEDEKFYVIFNSNNYGFFVWTTDDVENGKWSPHFIRTSFHDPALLFDDGHTYVIYNGSTLQEIELIDGYEDEVGEVQKVGAAKTLFEKSSAWGLWEGVHAYKIGEYYYLMIIASPNSGWFRSETCYRSKKLVDSTPSDWEEQIIFQGSTYEYGTGIAQGGIVDTIYGDWYGILFQDHNAIGRVPSILPVKWDVEGYEDWPMMGYYDGDDFVTCTSTSAKIPGPLTIRLNKSEQNTYIVGDDDFTYAEGEKLKLVWQWNHNPDNDNWSVTDNPGHYRITNARTCNNVWFARNSLTQRTVGPEFTSEAAMIPTSMNDGDYAGLVAVGSAYGMVGVRCSDGTLSIFQGSGSAGGKKEGTANEKIKVNATADEISSDTKVYLKIDYKFNTGSTNADTASFYYSLDGFSWSKIGTDLKISFDTATTFMGTRTWLTNYATLEEGGYVDFDYYKCYQN